MVNGLLDASIAYRKKEYLDKAEMFLKLIFKKFTNKKYQCNRLVYTNNLIKGTLEDYAWLISAAIKMGKIKNSSYWLEKSIDFTQAAISNFWQKEGNLFRLSNEQKLFKDVFELDDQVIPSSNSVMASNLYEIYKVTYDKYFLKICNKMLSAVALNAESSPSNFTNWMLLSMKVNSPKKQYVMVGFSVQELLEFYSEKEFFEDIYLLEKQSDLPIFKEKYNPNKKNIFICNEKFCLPAVLTTKQALNLEI